MIAFIEEQQTCGVEPVSRVLPIAPSTYYMHTAFARDPGKPRTGPNATPRYSTQSSAFTTQAKDNTERVRSGVSYDGSTAEPPGVPWTVSCESKNCKGSPGDARKPRSPTRPCPQEKVSRTFKAASPDQLCVADFTHVQTAMGMAYAAYVIDVFIWKIVLANAVRRWDF